MNEIYTLTLHLHSGQTIKFDCAGYSIVQTEDGLPMRLDYTPTDEWGKTLAFVDFRAIAAIEVERAETGSS